MLRLGAAAAAAAAVTVTVAVPTGPASRHRCEVSGSFQSDVRGFELKCKIKIIKIKMSPEPVTLMAARGPEVGGGNHVYVRCLSRSVDWQICQITAKCFVHFYSVPGNSGKLPRGYLKRHDATR